MPLITQKTSGPFRWRWSGPRRFKYTAVPSEPSEISGDQEALYSELDGSKKEIRLLDLQPAEEFASDIVCQLRTISLNTRDIQYDALSYAWGDTGIVDHVIVNGVFKQVTTSLASALRHLRSAKTVLTLWVDAICIDQGNTVEREQQVSHMRRIYRYASATRAWLGLSSVSNDLAFDFFTYLSNTPDAWQFDLPEYLSRAPAHFLDFKEIFQRAWWSRVWVLQEMALASKRTIHCGHRFITMQELVDAHQSLKELGKSGLLTMHAESIDVNHLSDLVATMGQSLELMNKLANADAEEDEQGFGFAKLLTLCRQNHATDSLDKIYGLLGMAPKWVREVIQPEYGQSTEELYTEICVRLAQRGNSPLILSQATTVQRGQNKEGWLPTWVPDWSYQGQRLINMDLRLQQEKLFNACGRFQDLALAPIHTKGVAMRGLPVNVIISISEKMPKHCEHMNAAACFASWEAFSLSGVSTKLFEESIDGAFTSAYWRTVLNGAVPIDDGSNLVRLESSDLKIFCTWREHNRAVQGRQEPFLLLNQRDRWTDYVSLTTGDRRLFMCADGTLGIGPTDTQAGDLVFVLAGGTQPFVLRPARRKLDLYSLVGECYIDTIMDGQATLRPPAYPNTLLKGQKATHQRRFPVLSGLSDFLCGLNAAISRLAEKSDLLNVFNPYERYHWDRKKRKYVRTTMKVLLWDAHSFSSREWRSPVRYICRPFEDEEDEAEERFFEYEINEQGEKVEFIAMGDFAERAEELRRRENRYGDDEKGWRTILLY